MKVSYFFQECVSMLDHPPSAPTEKLNNQETASLLKKQEAKHHNSAADCSALLASSPTSSTSATSPSNCVDKNLYQPEVEKMPIEKAKIAPSPV